MIHGVDHLLLAVPSPPEARDAYVRLLGLPAAVGDVGAPRLETPNADLRFTGRMADQPEGLAGIAFAVADLGKTRNLLERRGMRVLAADADAIAPGRLLIATDSTHGAAIALVERAPREPGPAVPAGGGAAVCGLDHVVIHTPNPERAVALYAGRLGLSLRLDRSEPSWGARLLFFRCGDLVVEVAHDLKAGVGDGNDSLWGLSWRVRDVAAAHARLRDAGVEVSAVRAGRRPGSRVFTVRSGTMGVPTLFIGMDG